MCNGGFVPASAVCSLPEMGGGDRWVNAKSDIRKKSGVNVLRPLFTPPEGIM